MFRHTPLALIVLCSGAAAGVQPGSIDSLVYDPEDPRAYEIEQSELVNPIARRGIALSVDSGVVHAAPAPRGAASADRAPIQEPVWSTEVEVDDAGWLRVRFGEVELAPATETARESYIRITSLYDGHEQYLDRESLAEWSYASAYFNGGRVRVEIMASPGNPHANSIELTGAIASEPTIFPRSICGPADDRQLSSDPRAGRLMPVGCTVWLFGDQPHSFLTAGHCGPSSNNVVQFNVPLSSAGGTPQNPPPQDQYPVDPASFQGTGSGIGNDWSFFGTFANSNTGLAPRDAMGDSYTLAASVPAPDQRDIRITGYGTTTSPVPASWYLAQKTHVGSFVSSPGTSLRYDPDTTGGNSGSAVLDDTTNTAIGIHTHAGCNFSGGSNQGTSLINPGLQNALANPRGITIPLGLDMGLVGIAPDFVNPAGGDTISVRVSPDNGRDPSGVVNMWVDTGSGFQPVPMTEGANDTFTAAFPPADCAANVRYYFTAEDTAGSDWSLPTAGASGALATFAGSGIVVAMDDNFQTNQGWTVQNTSLQTGAWTRADPGNYGREDPAADADGSGNAYVTGNGVNEDVDGGPTILTSPTIDLSGMNSPSVSYARWHQANSNDDRLFVEMSSDNGASWVIAESVTNISGWVDVQLSVADFVTPTSQFRIRFRVADTGTASIVESGVDAFRVIDITCDSPCPADFSPPGGNGTLNFDDVIAFLSAYNAGDAVADLDANGEFNFFDITVFLGAFNAGCP